MLRVKLVSHHPDPWRRQLPNLDGIFDGVRFILDQAVEDYDFLVVYDQLPGCRAYATPVPCERRILVASEPVTVKRYGPAAYLKQFGAILTTDPETPHGNVVVTQVGLPWHAGAWDSKGRSDDPLDFRFFDGYFPEKTKLVSVVASDKSFTQGHCDRLNFVSILKQCFGDRVDYYGRGINSFVDKLQVLAPYRYHIAIENYATEYYWTEKLADPFLCMSYPIYHGCTNIADKAYPSCSGHGHLWWLFAAPSHSRLRLPDGRG